MHFINNQILQRNFKLFHFAPVKVILNHSGMISEMLADFRVFPPVPLACNGAGVRVKQNIVFIKKKSFFLVIGAV